MLRGMLIGGLALLLVAGVACAQEEEQPLQSLAEAVGMELDELSEDDAYIVELITGQRGGVAVWSVRAGSPAELAGLQDGNGLLAIDGVSVDSLDSVEEALKGKTGQVKLLVLQVDEGAESGERVELTMDVGKGIVPAAAGGGAALPGPAPTPAPGPVTGSPPKPRLGLALEALRPEQLADLERQLGQRVGVRVAQVMPGSPAEAAGIRPGDILFTVAGANVTAPQEVAAAILGKVGEVPILLGRPGADGGLEARNLKATLGPEAALPPQPGPAPVPALDIRAKLQALDAARAAGILSDEEYAAKHAQLEAQLRAAAPQPDPAVQQKLQALDAARAAGLLTEGEYARKRAELMGGGGVPPATTGAVPAVTGPVALTRYADPAGRFQFSHGSDWIVAATDPSNLAATRGRGSLNITVTPAMASAQEAVESTLAGVRNQAQNYQERSRGPRAVAGLPGYMVEFKAVNPRGYESITNILAFGAGGTGFVLFLDVPADEFAAAAPGWEAILSSFRTAGAPPDGNAGGTAGGGGEGTTGGATGGSLWPTL